MNTIYDPFFENKIQREVINIALDKLLINNDMLLKSTITSFLSGNCDHCNILIFNPRLIDGKIHVCERCINKYIYCSVDECRNIKHYNHIKYQDRCQKCLSWFCEEHQEQFCCQTLYQKLKTKIKKKLIF